MFIQTEPTPNPATLKFLPGREIMTSGTADFPTAASAARSPLAERLFQIDGVTGVFLGSDFVTVTKGEDRNWQILKPAVLGIIMEHFTSGRPILVETVSSDTSDTEGAEPDSEVV
ncbi:MAG TPA: NifU N-terminal domain-containing protein, partial [Alphaproteobacteria bacterium]